MWKVLVRNRMCLVTLTGDIKQAFLQIRIRKKDRNVLRFDWIENMQSEDIKVYKITRTIFSLGESPFLLNGTVKKVSFRPFGAWRKGGAERAPPPLPPKFAENVPFFSKSPLNVSFLKIFHLK